MSTIIPRFLREGKAAKFMDLELAKFRALVESRILPGPIDLGGHKRWRVSELEAISSGVAMDEEFEV